MKENEKQAFSNRLILAMKATPDAVKTGTKHGVDAAKLKAKARVSREMARRYLEGMAIPNPDPMKAIAEWLNVRVTWLRDGEAPMAAGNTSVRENSGYYYPAQYQQLIADLDKLPISVTNHISSLISELARLSSQEETDRASKDGFEFGVKMAENTTESIKARKKQG